MRRACPYGPTKTLLPRMLLLVMAAWAGTLSPGCGGKGTGGCPEGSRLCPCSPDGACDAGLACNDGFCIDGAACPVGAEGCPCRADGSCDTREGVSMECRGAVCRVSDCPEGRLGCRCSAGACSPGVECVAGECRSPAGAGLFVGNPEVRACDVLLDRAGVTVAFSSGVIGEMAREGSRVAASFAAIADAALSGPVAAVVPREGKVQEPGGIALVSAECFDRLGRVVAAPDLKVQ